MLFRVHKKIILEILAIVPVIALTVWRQPEPFYQPRFFAEEGTLYFAYAFNHTWYENLFHPFLGYNTLFISITTSLATLLPLELAPFATTYSAFFLQLLISCAAMMADIPSLDSLLKRFMVALSIPLLFHTGVWLNVLGGHFILSVLTFLILLEEPAHRATSAVTVRAFSLVMAGLTGVMSCFMTPAFIYKSIKTRSRQFAMYSGILLVCSAVQVSVFILAMLKHDKGLAARFVHHDWTMMLAILVKFLDHQFFVPFFGRTIDESPILVPIEGGIRTMLPALATTEYALAQPTVAVGIFLILAAIAVKTSKSLNTRLFVISFVLVTSLSTFLSLNMSGGPRYTFAPAIMIVIFLMTSLGNPALNKWLKSIIVILMFFMVTTKLWESRLLMEIPREQHWPQWGEEVKLWRADNGYDLKIWPPPWVIKLEKR